LHVNVTVSSPFCLHLVFRVGPWVVPNGLFGGAWCWSRATSFFANDLSSLAITTWGVGSLLRYSLTTS
jgi:hypothetical protein